MSLNAKVVESALNTISMLKFFPADPGVRAQIALLIEKMCSTDEQVRWLARRTVDLVNEWPGPTVFRQIFCSKFAPKDGIDITCSEFFIDGIPPEKPQNRPTLEAPPAKRITAAEATEDPELQRLLTELQGKLKKQREARHV